MKHLRALEAFRERGSKANKLLIRYTTVTVYLENGVSTATYCPIPVQVVLRIYCAYKLAFMSHFFLSFSDVLRFSNDGS
jgi:hypothetical protein